MLSSFEKELITVPLEIKQLVIKSQTINDDNKTPSFGPDWSDIESDESVSAKVIPYPFMPSPDEIRER